MGNIKAKPEIFGYTKKDAINCLLAYYEFQNYNIKLVQQGLVFCINDQFLIYELKCDRHDIFDSQNRKKYKKTIYEAYLTKQLCSKTISSSIKNDLLLSIEINKLASKKSNLRQITRTTKTTKPTKIAKANKRKKDKND